MLKLLTLIRILDEYNLVFDFVFLLEGQTCASPIERKIPAVPAGNNVLEVVCAFKVGLVNFLHKAAVTWKQPSIHKNLTMSSW